jgi:hypothetical protein
MHWGGGDWILVPCKTKPTEAVLAGVAAVARDDAWAVGSWITKTGRGEALLVHWAGNDWRQVTSPTYRSAASLASVAGVAPDDVWAVGRIGDLDEYGNPNPSALAMHWDGTDWYLQTLPASPGRSFLNGVASDGHDSAWAVGAKEVGGALQSLVLRWEGNAWTEMPTPTLGTENALTGVSIGDGVVWASGWCDQAGMTLNPLVLQFQ